MKPYAYSYPIECGDYCISSFFSEVEQMLFFYLLFAKKRCEAKGRAPNHSRDHTFFFVESRRPTNLLYSASRICVQNYLEQL